MDTHFVVYWVDRREARLETLRRCRCQEHHLRDLTVTGTSRRPPYREKGVGEYDRATQWSPYCCVGVRIVSEMLASHDHTFDAAAACARLSAVPAR